MCIRDSPCTAGKNWQKLDFEPFGDQTRATKPLLFQKTKGKFPKRAIRELNRPYSEPDRHNREAPGKGRHRPIPGVSGLGPPRVEVLSQGDEPDRSRAHAVLSRDPVIARRASGLNATPQTRQPPPSS